MKCWCREANYKCTECLTIEKWRRLSPSDQTQLLIMKRAMDAGDMQTYSAAQLKLSDIYELGPADVPDKYILQQPKKRPLLQIEEDV